MKQKIHDIYGKEIFSPIHGYPTKIREKYLYSRLKLRYYKNRLKYGKAAPNSFEIIYIDPDDINKIIIPGFFREDRYTSRIKNGEWDLKNTDREYDGDKSERLIYDLENYDLYRALKQKIEEEKNWENTKFYSRMLSGINENEDFHGMKHKEDLEESLENKYELYKQIKKKGVKPQKELDGKFLDEILADISREGEFILEDGRHRALIAKIIGLDKIPVRVLVRHKKWQEKRKKAVKHPEELDEKYGEHSDIKPII